MRGAPPDVFSINASHDGGFALVDDTSSAIPPVANDVIPVAPPTRDATFPDPPQLAAPSFCGQVSKVELRDCALYTNHKTGNLAAVGYREQLHISIGEPLVDLGHVSLVAADSIKTLSEHPIE